MAKVKICLSGHLIQLTMSYINYIMPLDLNSKAGNACVSLGYCHFTVLED